MGAQKCNSLYVKQLLYLDRTKFDDVPVSRLRPVFKNWKGAIVIREKREVELGSFGTLELAEEYVEGAGQEDKEKDNVSGKEAST